MPRTTWNHNATIVLKLVEATDGISNPYMPPFRGHKKEWGPMTCASEGIGLICYRTQVCTGFGSEVPKPFFLEKGTYQWTKRQIIWRPDWFLKIFSTRPATETICHRKWSIYVNEPLWAGWFSNYQRCLWTEKREAFFHLACKILPPLESQTSNK